MASNDSYLSSNKSIPVMVDDSSSISEFFEYFEIILNILSQIVTIYYFLIFIKTSFVHTNMLRLIKLLFLYYILSQIARLITAVKEATVDGVRVFGNDSINYIVINDADSFIIFDLIRIGSLIAMLSTMLTIVYERIYATIKLKNYEKTVSSFFFLFCIQYQFIFAVSFTFAIYKEVIDLLFSGIAVFFLSISLYFIFYCIEWYNKKQYKVSLTKIKKYTLSERFQLQENIRTALLVKRFTIVLFILNFGIGFNAIASNYFLTENNKLLAYFTFNYFLSFYGIVLFSVGILGSPKIRRRLRNFICKGLVHPEAATPNLEKQTSSATEQLKSFNGIKLIFTQDEEREIAFKQLNDRWK